MSTEELAKRLWVSEHTFLWCECNGKYRAIMRANGRYCYKSGNTFAKMMHSTGKGKSNILSETIDFVRYRYGIDLLAIPEEQWQEIAGRRATFYGKNRQA
jgi:hypothetical protein